MKKGDLNLLLILAGVLLFAGLYFGVHNQMSVKATELEAEITPLQTKLDGLEEHYNKLPEYEAEVERIAEYTDLQLTMYPAAVLEEDFLVWVLDWEEYIGHEVDSVSFSDAEEIQAFPVYFTDGENRTLVDAVAFRSGVSVSSQMTYNQLKEGLDYIYSSQARTSLDTLNVAYDATTGQLVGTYDITKFSLMYPGAVYDPAAMPQTPLGVDEIFGTLEPVEAVPAA